MVSYAPKTCPMRIIEALRARAKGNRRSIAAEAMALLENTFPPARNFAAGGPPIYQYCGWGPCEAKHLHAMLA